TLFLPHLPTPPSSPPLPYTTLFRSVSTDHLLGKVHEALRRVAPGLVDGDRHARGGRFADLHGLTDDGAEHLVVTEILQRVEHVRSEEHTSELQSRFDLVCRLLLEKK